MDLDNATPLFTSGKELADLLLVDGIILKAWELIPKDFTNNENLFELKEGGNVIYVVFPSFLEDFRSGRYGECPIQNENRVFSDCLNDDDGRPALFHPGAFNRFEFILLHSNFKAQMEIIINRKTEQNIIFMGHSIGGAVATFATIWFLEKRVRHVSPFCITFGCPLVGDTRLGQAIGREDWSGKFCHVVSQYDAIPRMLLAPVESIAAHVDALLPYWLNIMDNDSPFIQEACRTILRNILQYTSLYAENYKEEFCPYRPFGTYIFCSRKGVACIEDPEAILNMLHLTMQSNEGNFFDARACVSEHTCYGDMLKHVIEVLVNTRRIASPDVGCSFEVQIELILEAIGVGAEYKKHALEALTKAGREKNTCDTNTRELNAELSQKQGKMAELEWYKTCYEAAGPGYYDHFKQEDEKGQAANLIRTNLETFWDDIIEKEKKHELPRDFQSQNKWINAGTAYRRLVEPLDIAYYYCHKKEESGSYLSPGVRPNRHIVLEKWLQEKEKTRSGRLKKPRTKFASLTEDSCFYAHLEEAWKDLKSLQDQVQSASYKEDLMKFEDYVSKMIKTHSISKEIFLQESSFMKWWEQYYKAQSQSPQWQSGSPLLDAMRREGWKNV